MDTNTQSRVSPIQTTSISLNLNFRLSNCFYVNCVKHNFGRVGLSQNRETNATRASNYILKEHFLFHSTKVLDRHVVNKAQAIQALAIEYRVAILVIFPLTSHIPIPILVAAPRAKNAVIFVIRTGRESPVILDFLGYQYRSVVLAHGTA